jgi:PAT family beta-lactamase induction signal transducer AmpG
VPTLIMIILQWSKEARQDKAAEELEVQKPSDL